MLETLLSGGITGLIGTIWSSYNTRKTIELELSDRDKQRSHEEAMVKAESDAMIAESKAQVRIEGARIAGEIELAETRAFEASQAAGQTRVFDRSYMDRLFEYQGRLRCIAVPAAVMVAILFGVVDFIKEMARPGITGYLLGLSTWITIKAWALLGRIQGQGITAEMAGAIVSDAINVVLYLTVTAATWWFGDRMAAKGMAKNLKLRGV